MKKTGRDHLAALGRSNSQMAEGQPNPENWKVVDHTGQKIGTVYDLLFDKKSKKVRYIINNLKNGELLKEERLVPMPVGRARYRKTEQEIVFPNITQDQLSSLPDFLTVEEFTQEDEHSVRNAFRSKDEGKASTGDINNDTFYDHKDFNEDVFYNRKAPATKDSGLQTTSTADSKKKEDITAPAGTVKKAGAGTATPLPGTKDQKTSSDSHKKKDEDVNVHPSPAERSADRFGSGKTDDKIKKTTNADKNDRERANGDKNRL